MDTQLNMKILHNPKAYPAIAKFIKETWRFSKQVGLGSVGQWSNTSKHKQARLISSQDSPKEKPSHLNTPLPYQITQRYVHIDLLKQPEGDLFPEQPRVFTGTLHTQCLIAL